MAQEVHLSIVHIAEARSVSRKVNDIQATIIFRRLIEGKPQQNMILVQASMAVANTERQ
jgi:hypothetical protein